MHVHSKPRSMLLLLLLMLMLMMLMMMVTMQTAVPQRRSKRPGPRPAQAHRGTICRRRVSHGNLRCTICSAGRCHALPGLLRGSSSLTLALT